MEQDLREQFIAKLEEKYGAWDKNTSRFGTTTFGTISQDLSISASQFSKLIYGTATEGMYQRSIENIKRLIQRESIRKQLETVEADNVSLKNELALKNRRTQKNTFLWLGISFFCLLLGPSLWYLSGASNQTPAQKNLVAPHPLKQFFDKEFDAKFKSPYLDINEVQEFCPASAYEGQWSLSDTYKLPLPGYKKPGLYYYAKSADVRMKCSHYDTSYVGKGRVLFAYEYLINEIWLDTQQTPISPKYFNKDSKTYTQEFADLVFENNPQFKKVATIHSFFTDKFEIYPDSIVRKGEPCGRYASDVDEELVSQYEIDIKYILNSILGDFTTTRCQASNNPFCNPNDLRENEGEIVFECLYTIGSENLGIGGGYPYQKGYRLEKQNYADNLLCDCEKGD